MSWESECPDCKTKWRSVARKHTCTCGRKLISQRKTLNNWDHNLELKTVPESYLTVAYLGLAPIFVFFLGIAFWHAPAVVCYSLTCIVLGTIFADEKTWHIRNRTLHITTGKHFNNIRNSLAWAIDGATSDADALHKINNYLVRRMRSLDMASTGSKAGETNTDND